MAHFAVPAHILTGKDALAEAVPYMKECGRRALIVTGKHVGKSPMMYLLKKALMEAGITYDVFDGITGEPTDQMIEEGVKQFRKSESEFVIGIGGGSPLDSAKAIAAMAVNEGNIADYNGKEITGKMPGIVAIPTTAGTGSEATKFTIITDQKNDIKMLLKGDCLLPDVAVVASDFSTDMPKSVTAATGLDALTHAVEAYIGRSTTRDTRQAALSAIQLIFANLPQAVANGNDSTVRKNMAHAAYLAGLAFTKSYVGYVHALAHALGGMYGVAHGFANAVLLPVVLRGYGSAVEKKLKDCAIAANIADTTTSPHEAAQRFIEAIEAMNRQFHIDTQIPQIRSEDLPYLCAHAAREANPLYPVPVLYSAAELEPFYRAVMIKEEK